MPEEHDYIYLCYGSSDGSQCILSGSGKGNGSYGALPVPPGIVHDPLYAAPSPLLWDHWSHVVFSGIRCFFSGYGSGHAHHRDAETQPADPVSAGPGS